MDARGLRELYDHHAWTLDRVFARALDVPEDLAAEPFVGDASLLATLAHIVTAERYWLATWQDRRYSPIDAASIASVARAWTRLQPETRAFLAGLADADLARPLRLRGPIGGGRDTLTLGIVHVINHGAQHRAEAAVRLTALGHSPGELDYIDFMGAREQSLKRT